MSIAVLSKSYLNKKYRLPKKEDQFLGFEQEVSKEKHLPLKLTEVHYTFANALRKVFTAEVPVLAINIDIESESIALEASNTQYHRDVLLDRIGFIPLDTKALIGENLSDIEFRICDPTDPKKPLRNETSNTMLVQLHKHLQTYRVSTQSRLVTDKGLPQFVPLDMLLLTLRPKEEVHAIMRAEWGTMRKHARWQASLVSFKYETAQDATDELETNEQLMDYLGHDNEEPRGIMMVVESFERLDANQVVLKGLESFKDKCLFFKQQILDYNANGKADYLTVDIDPNITNYTKMKILNDYRPLTAVVDKNPNILGEFHTLGPVLETYVLRKLMDLIKVTVQAEKDPNPKEAELRLLRESLCAYRKPHPLDAYVEFNVRTPKEPALAFPAGRYDEITDHPLRLVLLTIDDLEALCDQLMAQVQASLF